MKAIKSSGDHPITGTAEVEKTVFGQQEEGLRGRENNAKKLVVVGMENKGKGVSTLYEREIPHADAVCLGSFMKYYSDPAARVTTDRCTGYGPLAKDFANMVRVPVGQEGEQLPVTGQDDHDIKGMAKGDVPPRGRPTGLSRRIFL